MPTTPRPDDLRQRLSSWFPVRVAMRYIVLGLPIVLAAVLSAESDGAAPQPEHGAPSPVGAP